ncbi:MAG TPA: SDR family NAD(P)-dependent oxidoreductase [Anaerolineae bacterium]|nr:SDR family NAD(P)-dependent oxidoreductase [Anaerolineae bacterium]
MKALITGGAGFIGTNLADHLVRRGDEVVVYDNLSRFGSERNAEWLRAEHGDRWTLIQADVRDFERLRRAAAGVDVIYHLAAQVAVTTSVLDPRHDFEVNALGTFNVLEAARLSAGRPIVLYASTNKVYGGMEDVVVVEEVQRYAYRDYPEGIPETYPLDFHSPYGNSKGAGDQYVRDYARIYGLPTVVLRQSCIYGPHQFGVEDQGWVAWFIIAAVTGRPITIYGDGKQVRDVLWVGDLLDLYQATIDRIDVASGRVYNVGGGPENTLAVWTELGPMLEALFGAEIPVAWDDWRPGDQRIFVANVDKAARELGWRPRVGKEEGVRRLYEWVVANRDLFEE